MARERVERRLAAILAADVAGYSRQTGEGEEGTLARLKAHRRELIDPMVAKHHGRIVKTTGDGLLIEFVSMVEAVACALAVQRAMVERNAATPEEKRITFRVGVHLGDVIVEDADIHGDGVNIAARLEGIAEPGGVCISEDAFRQVRGKIDAECVVATIEPELYAAEHFRSRRKPPESLDAWECVIRALSCAGQFTRTGSQEAEVLCRRAMAIAPNYGQAHSLLAWVVTRRTSRSGGDVIAVLPEAMAEAQTALGLDERDSWAHMARGMVLWRMRRHGAAERTFRRALEFNPNLALARALIGLPLAAQGAHEEAIRSAEHARRLSPNDRLIGGYALHATLGAHFAAGPYVDCVAWAHRTIERSPENQAAHYFLVAANAMLGDRAAAVEALGALMRLRPDFSLTWLSENMAWAGEVGERLLAGLRRAGVPQG